MKTKEIANFIIDLKINMFLPYRFTPEEIKESKEDLLEAIESQDNERIQSYIEALKEDLEEGQDKQTEKEIEKALHMLNSI